MQKFLLNLAGLSLLTALLFLTSCDEDPIVTNPLGPEIQFLSDTDILSADADVIIGESFTVRIKLNKGDNPLNGLEIQEGDTKLDIGRIISINGGSTNLNNPFAILGADKDGATYDITITQGTHAVGDFTIYKFIVSDEKQETASVDIAITTTALPGTPLSMAITGVLFNQAGPAGTGGLDLDTGTGTGSTAAESELRDLGLDCTVAVGNENWRAQMGTINGAVMAKIDPAQIENFSFDNVDKKEQIADAYNANPALADGASVSCSSGNSTTVTNVSDVVVAGDMFAVFANDTYYLIRIDEVNYVGGSNGDNYSMSIKY